MCHLYFQTVNCNYSSILDLQVFLRKKKKIKPFASFEGLTALFVLKGPFFLVTGIVL